MATRTVKSDSGNALKLQNNGGTGSVTITDAGDLTIDSPADIVLDAEGADITLKDGGTTYGSLKQASGHLVIQPTSSKEIILNDQGGTAALTVDTANQNVSINNGNLVMGTAGKGIDFAAQTVSSKAGTTPTTSAGAEVLDHYERGTWTGVISDGTYDCAMDASYTTGKYTRIGNVVTISGLFISTSLGSPNPMANNVRLEGLPFDCGSDESNYGGVVSTYVGAASLGTAGYSIAVRLAPSTDYLTFWLWDSAAGTTSLTTPEWGGSSTSIAISGSYMIS